MPRTIKTTLKALSGVGVEVSTDKLTPGPVPSAATSEFEFIGDEFNGTAVGHFTNAMHGDGSGDLSYGTLARALPGSLRLLTLHAEGIAIFTGAILGHKGTIAYAARGTCTHKDMLVSAKLEFITSTGTGELSAIAGTGSYSMKIGAETTEVTLAIGCADEGK
ncbi:uncharacterized protein LOC62_05G006838 [Vanrija pseudolonga]|uniref:Uncharacterized protein n=1 Tax=Vanrija pseudolonga TaxID=143232 RepID=A0AAF1BMD7_9TREE|nr:hypothetical protein LOC62_05G006838 [Vanrija pseudolonga]